MSVKQIPLPNNKFVTVDEDMYEILAKHKWCCNSKGYVFRWIKNEKNGKYKPLYMQKEIIETKKGQVVSVKDRNLLNLTRENLIVTTRRSLSHHVRKNSSKSKYMGVYLNATSKKYLSYITYERQLYYLGSFNTEIDAALVRDFFSRKYYGDKAHINIPDQRLKSEEEVNKLIADSSSKKTGYYGVTKATKNLYRARLRHKGVNYDFGLHKTAIEAARVRDREILKLGLNVKKMNFISVSTNSKDG